MAQNMDIAAASQTLLVGVKSRTQLRLYCTTPTRDCRIKVFPQEESSSKVPVDLILRS